MSAFFSVMIYTSIIISYLVTGLFMIGILVKNKAIGDIETFNNCNTQLKTCKTASIIFIFLYWFISSGKSQVECLKGYETLSTIGARLGCIWVIIGVMNIVLSIILSITKRGKDQITIMNKLRTSSFLMGAILIVISFLLKVN